MSNIFKDLVELPVRRAIQVLRNKVADVGQQLDAPSFFDQYPGKPVPWIFSKTFLVEETDPADGIDLSAFVAPSDGPIQTGRDAAFFWCETQAFAFGQRNALSAPSKDLFDPTLQGGGCVHVPNLQGPLAVNNAGDLFSFVCAELDLYDRRRGRSITNGKIPLQTFAGGAAGPRRWRQPVRWDPDTEVEPRLYITEARSPAALATANNRFWVNVTFKGFMVLQETTGRETILAGEDDGATL